MAGSYVSFLQTRIPPLASIGTALPPELHYWSAAVANDLNTFVKPSLFSLATPESVVTALPGTLGINFALSSSASGLWFKRSGVSTIGWVAIA